MPQLELFKTSRQRPAGLLPGQTGQVDTRLGSVATGRVAKPAHLQFVGRDTSAPMKLGQQISGIADMVTDYAVNAAKVEQQAIGRSQALKRRQTLEDQMWGSGDNPGVFSLSGKKYVDAVRQFGVSAEDMIAADAEHLGSAARATYMGEMTNYMSATMNTARGRSTTEMQAYANDKRKAVNFQHAKTMGQATMARAVKLRTTDPAEISQFVGDLQSMITAEALSRAEVDGEDPVMAYDDTMVNVIKNIADSKGGVQVLSMGVGDGIMLLDLLANTVHDPKQRDSVGQVVFDATKQKNAERRLQDDTEDMDDRDTYRAILPQMIKTIAAIESEAGRREFGKSMAMAYPTLAADINGMVNSAMYKGVETAESTDITEAAIIAGQSALEAEATAANAGITLTSPERSRVSAAYISGVNPEVNRQLDRFDKEFKEIVKQVTGMFSADFTGNKSRNPGVAIMSAAIAKLRSALMASIGNPNVSMDDVYNKAKADFLSLDNVQNNVLYYDQEMSPVSAGIFKVVDLDMMTSYSNLMGQVIDNTPEGMLSPELYDKYSKSAVIADDPTHKHNKKAIATMKHLWEVANRKAWQSEDAYETAGADWEADLPKQWLAIDIRIRKSLGLIKGNTP